MGKCEREVGDVWMGIFLEKRVGFSGDGKCAHVKDTILPRKFKEMSLL